MAWFPAIDHGSRSAIRWRMAEFTLHKLHDSLGAEVQGLDLSKPLSPDTRKALIQAWIDHLVLLFRDQDLTPDTQRAFCEQFGELGGRLRKAEERPEGHDAGQHHAGHQRAQERRADRFPSRTARCSFITTSVTRRNLTGAQCSTRWRSPASADTRYSQTCTTPGTLPDDLKTKIDGHKVLHIYKYLPTERVDLTDDISKYDHQWQLHRHYPPKIRPPGALRQ